MVEFPEATGLAALLVEVVLEAVLESLEEDKVYVL